MTDNYKRVFGPARLSLYFYKAKEWSLLPSLPIWALSWQIMKSATCHRWTKMTLKMPNTILWIATQAPLPSMFCVTDPKYLTMGLTSHLNAGCWNSSSVHSLDDVVHSLQLPSTARQLWVEISSLQISVSHIFLVYFLKKKSCSSWITERWNWL